MNTDQPSVLLLFYRSLEATIDPHIRITDTVGAVICRRSTLKELTIDKRYAGLWAWATGGNYITSPTKSVYTGWALLLLYLICCWVVTLKARTLLPVRVWADGGYSRGSRPSLGAHCINVPLRNSGIKVNHWGPEDVWVASPQLVINPSPGIKRETCL